MHGVIEELGRDVSDGTLLLGDEPFHRLVRREGGSHLDQNPAAYLHRAAINAGLDLVRSRRASRATPLEDSLAGLSAPESGEADRTIVAYDILPPDPVGSMATAMRFAQADTYVIPFVFDVTNLDAMLTLRFELRDE